MGDLHVIKLMPLFNNIVFTTQFTLVTYHTWIGKDILTLGHHDDFIVYTYFDFKMYFDTQHRHI